MNIPIVVPVLLLIIGLFTLAIPSAFAQFIPQSTSTHPCENNGHAVLGTGKQIFKQSNRCIIIENSNVPTGTCPIGTVLQNGVCVPTTTLCPPGSILQNGVCVPFTNPTQSAPVAVASVLPSSAVNGGDTVKLVGSSSFATTSGATIVSYSWNQVSEPFVTLNPNPNTANPTFVAPTFTTTITLTFSLTVTDSNGLVSTPTSVTVTINPAQ